MKLLEQLQDDANKKLTIHKQIREWLEENVVEVANSNPASQITINPDLTVDCSGNISFIENSQITHFPIKFGKVSGTFKIINIPMLESLQGCPNTVGGGFIVQRTSIKSFVGCPARVGTSTTLSSDLISSTEGLPLHVGGTLYLSAVPNIISFHNIHKHCKYIQNLLEIDATKVRSHVLGVLLIKGLRGLKHTWGNDGTDWRQIINSHLQKDRDIIACQHELIEAGYEEYARL